MTGGTSASRWDQLLADPERGSAGPEITWLLLGFIVGIVGAFSLVITPHLGVQWFPVWISWTLIGRPIAALLWWLVINSAAQGEEERRN
ncbi:hypothetical protein ACVBEQ_26975 [Nakamurella sp. GG22]